MKIAYDLEKIKFATDGLTFEKAVVLYESGKVTKFENNGFTCTASVLGTEPYNVFVSNRYFDQGNCTCYLGQNDTLCKHMVAVALHAVMGTVNLLVMRIRNKFICPLAVESWVG